MRLRSNGEGRAGIVIPVTTSTPPWQVLECVASICDAMTPDNRARAGLQPQSPAISVKLVLSCGPGGAIQIPTPIPDRIMNTPGLTLDVVSGSGGSFAENTNRGIMRVLEEGCDWVLLLNADTHLAPGQLEEWQVTLSLIDDVAICGCTSNFIGGAALMEFPPDDIFTIANHHALAEEDWNASGPGGHTLHGLTMRVARDFLASKTRVLQLQDAPDIKMVAAAIPRWAFEQVGFLDTRFRPGNREDVDWCWRAHQAGFRTVFSHAIFVHHYGSTSFPKDDSWARAMADNRGRFNAKWSHTTRYQMSLQAHDYIVRPEKLLDVMEREEPYSLDPLLWRARCYGSVRPRMVLRDLVAYMGGYPNDPEAHWLAAEAMIQVGRISDAEDIVTDMRTCFPLMRRQIEQNLEPRLGKDRDA